MSAAARLARRFEPVLYEVASVHTRPLADAQSQIPLA